MDSTKISVILTDLKSIIVLNQWEDANTKRALSIGGNGFLRQIINVGDGTEATGAVNYSQLKGVENKIGNSDDVMWNVGVSLRVGTSGEERAKKEAEIFAKKGVNDYVFERFKKIDADNKALALRDKMLS